MASRPASSHQNRQTQIHEASPLPESVSRRMSVARCVRVSVGFDRPSLSSKAPVGKRTGVDPAGSISNRQFALREITQKEFLSVMNESSNPASAFVRIHTKPRLSSPNVRDKKRVHKALALSLL